MKKLAPLRDWPKAYPNLPLKISIIAFISSFLLPIITKALGME